MKKVLIISYYFPPDSEIGGLRIQGLAKYLPEFGWEPIILTKTNHNRHETPFRVIQTSHVDYNVLTSMKKRMGINPNIAIKKQIRMTNKKEKKSLIDPILNLFIEIFAYPDAQKDWCTHALNISHEILEHEEINALISSSSPVTSHVIAQKLKSDFEVPWVADLRDLWTQNHYYQYSIIRKLIEKKLEIKTLSGAEALTTVSEYFVNDLRIFHKCEHVYTILNGFDPQEVNVSTITTKKFTITYTGYFYQGKRDPSKLFQALQDLILEGIIDPNDIEVRIYGPQEDWMSKEINQYGLNDIVIEYGFVSRDISFEKQRESQVLLLLLWDHPKEIGVYPAKIFEYLAAQRPILAIGGEKGVVEELLEDTNAGVFTTNTEDIKKAIEYSYNEYKLNGNVAYKGNRARIINYSQKEMARKFSIVLDEITKKK